MEDDFWRAEAKAVAGLLRAHLQHAGTVAPVALETIRRAVETRQVSEAAAISNDLQSKIFDEKRATEHLQWQLKGLWEDMDSQRLDTPHLQEVIHDLEDELHGAQAQ